MTVYCEDCDFVHTATREKHPGSWRCMKAPTEPGYKFMSQDYSPEPPFHRCEIVNTHGECQGFEPRRNGQ
jgi:hypothetical protein